MLPKFKNKNSWILSVVNQEATKHYHHYFCTCSKEFKLTTEIYDPEAPNILCPMCGNDYFKDAVVFENMKSTKIWKYFKWVIVLNENKDDWNVTIKYDLPIYDELTNQVKLQNQDLLHITLKKDGSLPFKVSYKSKIISQYSLYLDDEVQPFKKLLQDEARESLYKFIMMNRSESIGWLDADDMKELSLDEKLNYITYFLKNSHLKEHRSFFWRMDNLHNHTIKYTTQVQMLDFIVNNRKEKSVKKALYKAYESSISHLGYYPYSDYVFSRTIDNINLLTKLYEIYPAIKQHLFTNETFSVAIAFIQFLKKHYAEKQIVKLFVEEMQDVKEYKNVLHNWRDTLRMLQVHNAFEYLEQHFIKVKLTSKKLHDEIIRVFHIVSYELDSKEGFQYDEKYLSACGRYKELEFKLPQSVKELSLWATVLHNCMFGYSSRIHRQQSVIYGVFKNEELLYAVELSNFSIVQAKAVSNGPVPEGDMSAIRGWKSDCLLACK